MQTVTTIEGIINGMQIKPEERNFPELSTDHTFALIISMVITMIIVVSVIVLPLLMMRGVQLVLKFTRNLRS